MKPIFRLLCATTLAIPLAGTALAAGRQTTKAELPPPPGLDEAGVTATAQASDATAPPTAVAPAAQDPLAPLPKPDARLVRDKASRDASATEQRIAGSDITTRKQGSDTVEEYREHGHVWMIKIVPPAGPTQTFMDPDGSGRLARNPNEGPISPVYYTLYEWK